MSREDPPNPRSSLVSFQHPEFNEIQKEIIPMDDSNAFFDSESICDKSIVGLGRCRPTIDSTVFLMLHTVSMDIIKQSSIHYDRALC